MKILGPMKAIRAKCLDCHGNNSKGVQFCPADGINSTWCTLWPYRFGMRPKKALRLYPDFMDPEKMPDGDTPLEELRQVAAIHPAAGSGAAADCTRMQLVRKAIKKAPAGGAKPTPPNSQ